MTAASVANYNVKGTMAYDKLETAIKSTWCSVGYVNFVCANLACNGQNH